MKHIRTKIRLTILILSPSSTYNILTNSLKITFKGSGTSGSSGSAGTAIRWDSQESRTSVEEPWSARRENSISMKEWDIPYEQLQLGEKIGSGRFSTGKKNVILNFRVHGQTMKHWCAFCTLGNWTIGILIKSGK